METTTATAAISDQSRPGGLILIDRNGSEVGYAGRTLIPGGDPDVALARVGYRRTTDWATAQGRAYVRSAGIERAQ